MGIFDKLFGRREKISASDAAFELSQSLYDLCIDTGVEISKRCGQLTDEAQWQLLAELLAFAYHVCDRHAFGLFGPVKRSAFMDLLLEGICARYAEELKRLAKDDRFREENDVKAQCLNLIKFFHTRQEEYGKYSKLTDREPAGTLCWELSKSIAKNFFGKDIPTLTTIYMNIMVLFASLGEAFNTLEKKFEIVF